MFNSSTPAGVAVGVAVAVAVGLGVADGLAVAVAVGVAVAVAVGVAAGLAVAVGVGEGVTRPSKVYPWATSIRLKSDPPTPPNDGVLFAGWASVIVLAVTSWSRLSIGFASLTVENGTKMVIVPFAPNVDWQFAAGSVVAPG
jgi:hypothetical protein